MSMIPKGGDTIWGGVDWSPEEGYLPSKKIKQRTKSTEVSGENDDGSTESKGRNINYGRIISFGKDVAEANSSAIQRIDFRVISPGIYVKQGFLLSLYCTII